MASKALPSGINGLISPRKALSLQQTRFISRRSQFPPALHTSFASTPNRRSPASIRIPQVTTTKRFAHYIPRLNTSPEPQPNTPRQPSYELTFTCVPCGTRSAHNVSKQGYHHGSVLITCPSCRNRHVISDHLRIFGNQNVTIEELMKERGQLVKRGTLGEDGDLEFWEDGTTTSREDRQGEGEGKDPKPRTRDKGAASAEGDAPGSTFGKT